MPASSIDRLQTPYKNFFLRRLSANFRPLGKVGQVQRGQRAFRAACLQRGIILTEVNVKHIANHTMEISQEATCAFAATGGTPASGTISSGTAWDEIDFAAASPGQLITASCASPVAVGQRVVDVP